MKSLLKRCLEYISIRHPVGPPFHTKCDFCKLHDDLEEALNLLETLEPSELRTAFMRGFMYARDLESARKEAYRLYPV